MCLTKHLLVLGPKLESFLCFFVACLPQSNFHTEALTSMSKLYMLYCKVLITLHQFTCKEDCLICGCEVGRPYMNYFFLLLLLKTVKGLALLLMGPKSRC